MNFLTMTSVENKEDSAKINDIHETTSKTPWRVQTGTRYCVQFLRFKDMLCVNLKDERDLAGPGVYLLASELEL